MTYNSKYVPIVVGSKGDKGNAGSDGTYQDTGNWATSTSYATNERAKHAKTGYGACQYRCIADHISGASTEPEVGASWQTYWELWVEGGMNGAGTGDTTGAASSVLNDIAGFADTSGKLLKSLGSFATCLSTALSALAAYTTAPAGASDKIAMLVGGVWKLITADDFAKRKAYLSIAAQAWKPSSTSGCGDPANAELTTNKMNLTSLAFNYAAKTYACYKLKFPIGYDGTALDAVFEWHSTGTTSNGVRWGIQLASIGDNETLDATWGTAVEVTDTATGAANRNLITSTFASITPAGTPASGETLEIRIYRDPTHADDNLDEIVYLDDVTLMIPMNKHSEA